MRSCFARGVYGINEGSVRRGGFVVLELTSHARQFQDDEAQSRFGPH
jgi:hypothetical protein